MISNFLTAMANILAGTADATRRNAALRIAIDRMQDMADDKKEFLATNSALLDRKNHLLDEVNSLSRDLQHRFRNHLQLIYAMLSDQRRATADAAAAKGINEIARRIMALAQIYEHVVGTGLSNAIDFGAYLSSLCLCIADAEANQHPNIQLTCHCGQLVLGLETVTSLGLIVTELVSNCFEHAFPDGTGSIDVLLNGGQPGEDTTLIVSDDGVGFAEKDDSGRHGLGLVKRLMEEVKGLATLRSDHGTKWTLKFPVHRPVIVRLAPV